MNVENKFCLIPAPRSDFDGLLSAVLLKYLAFDHPLSETIRKED